MDIEIQSQTKNPLLHRTDVHFTVQHTGEQTPKREFIRNELAEKLKVNKEQVIIDNMKSQFGLSRTKGYAKIYKTLKEAQSFERDHILKRNHATDKGQKTKEGKKSSDEKTESTPAEPAPTEKIPETSKSPEPNDETPKQEEKKPEEQPPEEKKE